MAIYHMSAKVIGRSSGRSATASAAYRSGEVIADSRTGEVHDYQQRRSSVRYKEILAPAGSPAWATDRAMLWNAVEAGEKRKDAQLCREVILALPDELSEDARRELVRGYVAEQYVARGMVADVAIHTPSRKGDERNHHAHVLLTMRSLEGEVFGAKAREWNDPALLEQWRESWALHVNAALERAGREERIDHRSLEAQGIERMPTRHMGPAVVGMMRRKAWADRAATAAEVQAANAELETIQTQSETARQQLDALLNSPDQRQELAKAWTKAVLGKIDPLASREEGARWIDQQTAALEQQKRMALLQGAKYQSGRAWFEAQPVPGGGVGGYYVPTYAQQLKSLDQSIRHEQARAVKAEMQIAGHRYTKSWLFRVLHERDPRLDQWATEAAEARKIEHSLVQQKDAIEAQWIGHEEGWEIAARLNREENEARIGKIDLQIDGLQLARETVLRKLAQRDADPQILAERQALQERKRQQKRERQKSRGDFEKER